MTDDPYVHESSYIEDDVEIGRGTRIWYFCHVRTGARIGEECNIGQNAYVDKNVEIGDRVKLQNNVSVYVGVTLDDEVFVGPSAVFTNVINPRAFINRMSEVKKTHVGRGATIGANATIVCGNDIGPYAFIGAGAVVIREVPAHALVVGNPSRRVGWVCHCGNKLIEQERVGLCGECGRTYTLHDDGIEPEQA